MTQGEALLDAVRARFFGKFRVSVMFDCNGSNTTASALVAYLAHGRNLSGKRAVVLAGSGPVGQRAAVLLAREGAAVVITGRKLAVVKDGVSLQQLVDGLNGLGIGPRDLIGILQAIKAAGAIEADIEVM